MGSLTTLVLKNLGVKSELEDAGISLMTSFNAAFAELIKNDKLLLVYFYEPHSIMDNTFLKLLQNKDVNSFFVSGFIIYITNSYQYESEFSLIMKGKMGKVNNLYVFTSNGGHDLNYLSEMNVFETSQEKMFYTLFQLQNSYQEDLIKKYGNDIQKCSKDYFSNSWAKNFKYVSLLDALNITMNQPVKHLRKILMLYMRKSESTLTKQLNKYLDVGILQKYNSLLVPVIWNISDRKYHKALRFACRRYFDQCVLEQTVSSKEGGIFFFMPDSKELKSTPRIFTRVTSFDGLLELNNTMDYLFNEFQTSNAITDVHELDAIKSYTNNMPLFNFVERNSLHEIIEKCIQNPCKLLLLYFYNKQSKLLNILPNIQSLLHKEQVIFLPWNISDPKRNLILATALERSFGLKKVEILLKSQISALFMFLPIGNTMVLHSMIADCATSSNLVSAYKAAHQFFILDCALGNDNDQSGPAAFQQIMCDQLGDRDFDCFQLEKGQAVELRKKVAFAFYGPPASNDGTYKESEEAHITKATNKITMEASMLGDDKNRLYVSFMRVCVTPLPQEKHKKLETDDSYQPTKDFCAYPLFGIRKCFDCPQGETPCRKYVDHVGRVYENWEDFIENNKYPKVMLIAPKNGKYKTDYRGIVQLQICPSPACGIGVAILRGVDIGACVVGTIAGVLGVVSTIVAVPFLPIVAVGTGIGVGTYSIVRSSITLANRAKYGESMSITEAEARGAYFNIIAGSLGFTTAGAGFALAYATRAGADIGIAARSVMNGLTVANLTASGAAVGNSAYDVISKWIQDGVPDALGLIQMTSSVLFFGHAVYNVQFAHTIISNNQTSVISDILDSLSSNRQRKTLLRLINTTAEQYGNAATGNAHVIKYIKSVDNLQDVIRVLTRDTKVLSRSGVKFSVSNGEIVFNGVVMDVKEFGNMSKIQRSNALSALASEARVTQKLGSPVKYNAKSIDNALLLYQKIGPILNLVNSSEGCFLKAVEYLLAFFTPFVQQILVDMMGKVLHTVGKRKSDLYLSLSSLYPVSQLPLQVMQILIEYYWDKMIQSNLSDNVKQHSDIVIKSMEKVIIISQFSIATLIREIIVFMSKWVMQEMITRRTNEEPSPIASRQIKQCDKCKGKFYGDS